MKISDVATVRNSMWLEPDAEPLFDYDGTINLMLQRLEGVQGILLSEQTIAEASVDPTR